ncbi:hypothetical protein ACWA7J_01730 [Leptothrix sp. BB-4]
MNLQLMTLALTPGAYAQLQASDPATPEGDDPVDEPPERWFNWRWPATGGGELRRLCCLPDPAAHPQVWRSWLAGAADAGLAAVAVLCLDECDGLLPLTDAGSGTHATPANLGLLPMDPADADATDALRRQLQMPEPEVFEALGQFRCGEDEELSLTPPLSATRSRDWLEALERWLAMPGHARQVEREHGLPPRWHRRAMGPARAIVPADLLDDAPDRPLQPGDVLPVRGLPAAGIRLDANGRLQGAGLLPRPAADLDPSGALQHWLDLRLSPTPQRTPPREPAWRSGVDAILHCVWPVAGFVARAASEGLFVQTVDLAERDLQLVLQLRFDADGADVELLLRAGPNARLPLWLALRCGDAQPWSFQLARAGLSRGHWPGVSSGLPIEALFHDQDHAQGHPDDHDDKTS